VLTRWLATIVVGAVLSGCGAGEPTAGGGSGAGSTAEPGTGLRGRAVATPGCPVERVSHPCPPVPVVAHIEITRASSAQVVESLDSATDGRFTADLPAGDYTVTATVPHSLVMPQGATLTAAVTPGRYTPVVIQFDSGIR
jgi:hypothetical protein